MLNFDIHLFIESQTILYTEVGNSSYTVYSYLQLNQQLLRYTQQ